MMKFFAFLFSTSVVFGLIALSIHFIKKYDTEKQQEVLDTPGFTKGFISKVRSYKGRGMNIQYRVKGKAYTLNTGVKDSTFANYSEGDSIELIYSLVNPEKAIIKRESINDN